MVKAGIQQYLDAQKGSGVLEGNKLPHNSGCGVFPPRPLLVPAWRVAYEKIDENTFCMPDFSIALHVEFISLGKAEALKIIIPCLPPKKTKIVEKSLHNQKVGGIICWRKRWKGVLSSQVPLLINL